MSDETPVVETPVVEPAAPVTPTEVVYEYQPVDDLGRPLGAKQVFKGKDFQEIANKIAESNMNLVKLNRDLNRKNRLGEFVPDNIPETAKRINRDAVDFRPRPLTDEERISLAHDMADPAKFDEASDRLFTAKIGASPKRISEVLTSAQDDIAAMRTKEEGDLFVKANPSYYVCMENFRTIANWMMKNDLAPVRENFQLAFDTLKPVGLLVEAPIPREDHPPVVAAPVVAPVVEQPPVNSQPEPEPVSRITNDEPQTQPKRTPRVASGLTRDQGSDFGTPSKSNTLTVAEIEAMSSEVYKKRLLTEPGFSKAVDEAYAPKK